MKWLALLLVLQACLPPPKRPPVAGYGEPYRGTGQQLFLKDSRTDWDITEGDHKLTPEQALEAAGDQEYEARRQIMKAHNEHLYRVAKHHQSTAKKMLYASIAAIAVGWIGGTLAASALETTTITPATAMDPAMQEVAPGSSSKLVSAVGVLLVLAGTGGAVYAGYGAIKRPPYFEWHVPASMNRPAYIRQQVEPYNEKLTPANPIPSRRPTGPMLPGHRPGAQRPAGPPGMRPPPPPPGQRPPPPPPPMGRGHR